MQPAARRTVSTNTEPAVRPDRSTRERWLAAAYCQLQVATLEGYSLRGELARAMEREANEREAAARGEEIASLRDDLAKAGRHLRL